METTLSFTMYFVKSLKVLAGKPKGKVHSSERWGSYSDRILIEVHVDPKEHMLASIEASAMLTTPHVGLSFIKKGLWRLNTKAPYGVGCKGQPLVPLRDIAQGHRGSFTWPFGTRVKILEAPDCVPMRKTCFVADRFGPTADAIKNKREDRVDLFVGDEKYNEIGTLIADVEKPWTNDGKYREIVRGAQCCLNRLSDLTDNQYPGENGKRLGEDNGYGTQTAHALKTWYHANRNLFTHPVVNLHPTDPEIYWTLRNHLRMVVEK